MPRAWGGRGRDRGGSASGIRRKARRRGRCGDGPLVGLTSRRDSRDSRSGGSERLIALMSNWVAAGAGLEPATAAVLSHRPCSTSELSRWPPRCLSIRRRTSPCAARLARQCLHRPWETNPLPFRGPHPVTDKTGAAFFQGSRRNPFIAPVRSRLRRSPPLRQSVCVPRQSRQRGRRPLAVRLWRRTARGL